MYALGAISRDFNFFFFNAFTTYGCFIAERVSGDSHFIPILFLFVCTFIFPFKFLFVL